MRDTSVAIAKAILARYAQGAAIVDISHHVAHYDLQQASYLLLSAYRHFPKGTIHVVPVDVFAGDAPRMLLAKKDGFYFIAPDNGILPLAFGTEIDSVRLCFEFSKPFPFPDWINNAGKVQEWVNSLHNVRSLDQKPLFVVLRSVMWKIDGKDAQGKIFSKQLRVDIPL